MGRKISELLPQKVTSVARWLGVYPGQTECAITGLQTVKGFKPDTLQLVIQVDKGGCLLNVNGENQDVLIAAFGDDADVWIGKRIVIGSKTIPFKGQLVTVLTFTPVKGQ